ncbi:Nucleoredoxin [Tetrabaena socialis]|uniref:Nucleoredoxin n=1 Tax=Tetrabaena socialis TaxID=47790 RepID=A0A2J7ZT14_9CHLO|nr:Nucleoredoxin [Tetrabaena socialis]|eukprot:PNH03411.1 Nucleoredoxin [Tetrabaena socialis]
MVETKPADVICDGDVCRKVTPEEASAAKAAPDAPVSGSPRVFQLLGSSLVGQNGSDVALSTITGPGKVLALYFSAHWCPPCRGFTPILAATYKRFKASHARAADWEVVFVSSDRDEAAWKDYFAEMPWTALPLAAREAKAELSKLYKVSGIPTLVLVDGESGELITASGRDAVGDDEECANFPWKPKTFAQVGQAVGRREGGAHGRAGGSVPRGGARGGRFTPKLLETMAALRAAGRAVEAVFVSGDRGEEAFAEYHSHMSWPALPYADRKRAAELNSLYDTAGIPTLVVLDEQHKVITDEGVGAVAADPTGSRFPWHRQPLEPLSSHTAGRINAGKVVVLVVDEAAADAAGGAEAFAEAALGAVAAATVKGAGGEEWAFLWAKKGDEMAQSVLAFAGLIADEGAEAPAGHVAVLLDVPGSQRVWDLAAGGGVGAEALAKAVGEYKLGSLGPGKKVGGEGESDGSDEE